MPPSGLTASIIQDTGGARLVIKGETGAAQGFTIDGSAGLEAFEFGPGASGMTWSTQAANAVIVADGVAVERTTTRVSDLVPGVKLDLLDRKSTRLNSRHYCAYRMPSSVCK